MSKDLISELRYLSRKLIRELGMLRLNQSKSGRTPQHWHALIEINKDPGITISKLGKLLLLSTSATSRIVDYLINHELVTSKGGLDKREKQLSITHNGLVEISRIDEFSNTKIVGAFEFLTPDEQVQIIGAMQKYSEALEKSRMLREQVKIRTLSTSRTLRKQIMNMIENIQINEFSVPVTPDINIGILRAEEEYYYDNGYHFWYGTDDKGQIIGSIGLKRLDDKNGEVKKFFVAQKYRRKGVAQKLMDTMLKSAARNGFVTLYLGTVDKLKAAQRFYEKYGFDRLMKQQLPAEFDICPVDTVFYSAKTEEVLQKLTPALE